MSLDRLAHELDRKGATGLSGSAPSVDRMSTVDEFFDAYRAALLARDEKTVGELYAVPGLILFPGAAIAVSDSAQTEAFFASSWSQYDGVTAADHEITVMATAPGTVWADVTWTYDGEPRERFCYQLVEGQDGYRIAVPTPMELPAPTR
jgi:hypothetical protein